MPNNQSQEYLQNGLRPVDVVMIRNHDLDAAVYQELGLNPLRQEGERLRLQAERPPVANSRPEAERPENAIVPPASVGDLDVRQIDRLIDEAYDNAQAA